MNKKIYPVIVLLLTVMFSTACGSAQQAEQNGPQTLTLATWHASGYLTQAVEGFNASQDRYRVEIKDYAPFDDYESDIPGDSIKGQTMLNLDIASGNIPDLINLHGIDRTSYAKQGAFVNLYDLMESDDRYGKEAFLENYLQANEIEGELYWLSPGFFVDSMIANKSLTQGMDKWSMEQFLNISEKTVSDGLEIMEHQEPTEFMTLMGAGNQFLNQMTETVRYDDPAYARGLEFSSVLAKDAHGHDHGHDHSHDVSPNEDAKKYASGQRLLARATFADYKQYASHFALFGDQAATMIGYPTLDGSSGTYFGMGQELYGISANASSKEGAWEYVKFALDFEDGQEDTMPQFSVVRSKLEKQLQNSIDSYTDGTYETRKGVEIKLKKPTSADIDEFMRLIGNIDSFANYESMFSKEIYALYDDFYAGTKTAEEVARILQDKYSLYFKENQ